MILSMLNIVLYFELLSTLIGIPDTISSIPHLYMLDQAGEFGQNEQYEDSTAQVSLQHADLQVRLYYYACTIPIQLLQAVPFLFPFP